MTRTFFVGAVVVLSVSFSLTLGANQAAAQGPAGFGASAAVQNSSHSMNPMKWFKKNSKNSPLPPAVRSSAEKKLTPSLQAQGILAAHVTAAGACATFATLDGCLAALHASHNLGLDFVCVRAYVTGVHTSTDLSSCTVVDNGKAHDLNKTIHQLKPAINAKQAAKQAEQQAEGDLQKAGA